MIRVTKVTDYGFILLAQIVARNHSGEAVCNARDLALQCGVPLPMASKILKALARGGILASHRGMKGGYVLTREPEKITVSEIVEALEGPIALTECLGPSPTHCTLDHLCPLQANWGRINTAIRSALEQISLAEMARPVIERGHAAAAAPAPAELESVHA